MSLHVRTPRVSASYLDNVDALKSSDPARRLLISIVAQTELPVAVVAPTVDLQTYNTSRPWWFEIAAASSSVCLRIFLVNSVRLPCLGERCVRTDNLNQVRPFHTLSHVFTEAFKRTKDWSRQHVRPPAARLTSVYCTSPLSRTAIEQS